MPVNDSTSGFESILKCSSCKYIVGTFDRRTQGFKLSKLALSASPSERCVQTFNSTKWLSCHILSSMDNQGLRRFLVISSRKSEDPLLIWIFAPDLTIASSASPDPKPLRVAKILWKRVPAEARDGRLDAQSLSEGEIEMPEFEFDALRRSLQDSAALLPEGSRSFQDWQTALLARFTDDDAVLP